MSTSIKHEDDTIPNFCTNDYKPGPDLKEHIMSVRVKEELQCKHCDYNAKRKRNLIEHVQNVHERVTLNCSIENCEYTSHRKYNIKLHIKTEHFNEWHQCNLCDYQARRKSNLTEHVLNVHEKSTNTICIACNISVQKHSLAKHMKTIHSEVQPKFYCKLCKFKTLYKSSIKKHISREHVNFDSEPEL